jgi:hypothetical protein
MYGDQRDESKFGLDPRTLLALGGGVAAGAVGKRYATRELGKGFQNAYNRDVRGIEKVLSEKAEAVSAIQAQLRQLEKDRIPGRMGGVRGIFDRKGLQTFQNENPAYLEGVAQLSAAKAAQKEEAGVQKGLMDEAGDRLAGKNEWLNEMGLAVGGVPAAVLGYGIGSGVMRKKDDPNDPYRNPLR